jgi:uncharacterized Tic20 family protein
MNESIPPSQTPPHAVPPTSSNSWEVLCHAAAAAGFIIPFGNIFGPLIVWLMKRSESAGIDAHGKESLNFQISWTIYGIVLGIITAILWIILVGILLVPVLFIGWVVWVVLTIIASVKASNGVLYRYPLTIRFLK